MTRSTLTLTDLQDAANMAAKTLDLVDHPKVLFKNIRVGKCHPKTKTVSVPQWAAKHGDAYLLYYVLHEVCHFIEMSHNSVFKAAEDKCLQEWELTIVYGKAYANKLLNKAGEVVYDKKLRVAAWYADQLYPKAA